jgi:hypothetical protein
MVLSDEILMAYADGELGPSETREVAAAVAADPALAARVKVFTQSRKAVAEAFAVKASRPTPDPIAERIRELAAETASPQSTERAAEEKVIAFPQRRRVPFWQLPIAASIALLAGYGLGQYLDTAPLSGPMAASVLGEPDLPAILATAPSGNRQTLDSGAEVIFIATFENGDGNLCREFEHDQPNRTTTVAVACRTADDWQVQLAIVAGAGADGYAAASSLDALDAWLTATGAGAPMSPQDELTALAISSNE